MPFSPTEHLERTFHNDGVDSARQVHPHAEYLVAAAARLGVENLSEDTSAQYLRDSDAKVPAAMLARQQKQGAQAAAQTAAQKEN